MEHTNRDSVKSDIMNKILRASIFYLIPIYLLSLLRIVSIGWQNIYLLHTVFLLTVFFLFVYRKRLSLYVKIHCYSVMFIVIAITGLVKFGFSGSFYFCFLPVLINGILLGKKYAYIYVTATAVTFSAVGGVIVYKLITPKIDLNAYQQSFFSWMMLVLAVVFICYVIVIVSSEMYQYYKNALCELKDIKDTLEIQVNKRTEDLESALLNLKSAQTKLVQSEKMASMGTLTSGIAHEINNPLNFIHGGYLGLKDKFDNELIDEKPEVENLLNAINIGIIRTTRIVSSLNQLSSATNNDELCEIDAIVDNCLLMLQNRLINKVVVNKKTLTDKATICGNVGQIHQVFMHVITNAEQAIKKKGNIDITIEKVGSSIVVTIADNGEGIKEEHLPKIIEPFFTTKPPNMGVGLGLSITYNIIKEHKGQLDFKSQTNTGTSVEITLPINLELCS